MCGRYYIDDEVDDDELREILEEIQRKIDSLENDIKIKMSGEIFPQDIVPIVANNKRLAPTPFIMKWGYSPFKEGGRPIINARSETASQKRTFSGSMQKHRCLIPATSYFEWETTDAGKVKHAIRPSGAKMMYMAGLYRLEHNEPVFTILTKAPSDKIAFIHDRMPVILPRDLKGEWLDLNNDADEVIRAALSDMEHRIA